MDGFDHVLRYFHPVLRSKKLKKKPVRVTFGKKNYVFFRDAEGRAAALLDKCPHRHVPLSLGKVNAEGRITCPYHGWTFDGQGNGHVPSAPATRNCSAWAFQVVEKQGYLWLAEKNVEASTFPRICPEGYSPGSSFSFRVKAPIEVLIANASEFEHGPFVHTFGGWTSEQLKERLPEHFCEEREDEVLFSMTGLQRSSSIRRNYRKKSGELFTLSGVMRFDPPRFQASASWVDPGSDRPKSYDHKMMVFYVPIDDAFTDVIIFSSVKDREDISRLARYLGGKVSLFVEWYTLRQDARFMSKVDSWTRALKGMKRTGLDRAIVANTKLLRRIYFGKSTPVSSSTSGDSNGYDGNEMQYPAARSAAAAEFTV
jgi:phenylpropionate dioxygenase-like ring-hydroxylating dioxygenase large terminal subunit